ncbi:MAG: lysylphosphatidylglycerol synthase transmembrane domain-containing protein [Anaerolineae bacterium]
MLKGKFGWLLRIALTIALFVVMFAFFVDVDELLQDIRQVAVGWLLAATVVKGIGVLAAILRWDQLLRGQGYRAPLGYLTSSFLVGRFIGVFLPSTIGLDGYRAYDVARQAKDTVGSVAVILVEKITGFFTLSLLVLVTLPAGLRFLPIQALIVVCVIFCAPVAVSFALLLKPTLVEWLLDRLLGLRFPGKAKVEGLLRRSVAAVTVYQDRRGVLLRAVLLGIVVHGSTALMYYFCALAVGVEAGLADMLFVGPWIILATVGLPTIGGEGAREFTALGLLSRIGVGESAAWLVGHLGFWAAEFVPAVIGGLILALRPEQYRPDIQRAETLSTQKEEVTGTT